MISEKNYDKSDCKNDEKTKGHILQIIAAFSGKIKTKLIYKNFYLKLIKFDYMQVIFFFLVNILSKSSEFLTFMAMIIFYLM